MLEVIFGSLVHCIRLDPVLWAMSTVLIRTDDNSALPVVDGREGC